MTEVQAARAGSFDDIPIYLTNARGDARYKPLAYVPAWTDITGKPSVFPPDTHNHDALYAPLSHNHDDRYFTETESDARYLQSVPSSYATDAEVASAISTHEAASDPHPGYLTQTEGDTRYIQESERGDFATASDLSDHLADATDAHDASAISFTPAGTIAATNVQAAIEEAASEASSGGGVADHGALTGLSDDDHSAVYVRYTIGPSAPSVPRVGDFWLVTA